MVVICVSDVADRFHGFLRSVMLNPHPGVYVSMDLDLASRDRIWRILQGW
jgi:CRISPR-associated protein Cas2